MALVPAPPAVTVRIPALVTVPASVSFAPAAYEVTLEKLGVAPREAAAVGTASA